MKDVYASVVLLLIFSGSSALAQIGAPIPTPLDQWRPVAPGTWKIKSIRSGSAASQQPATTTTVACPYSALLFLNKMASVKVGEAGCRHETYKLSEQSYHITTQCRGLRGADHYETTTLQVSNDGRRFTAATTWNNSNDTVTLQREGELLSECKAN